MRNVALAFAAAALFACHREHDVASAPPPWMDGKIDQQAKASDPKSEKVGDTLHGTARQDDDKVEWSVPLDSQHCYWLSGVGEDTVQKLSIYVFDANDHRVDSRRSGSSTALLKICPTMGGMYRIEGKVAEGYGHFAAGVYRTDPAAAPPPPPPPPVAAPPPDLGAAIEQQAQAAAPGATRVGNWFDGHADFTDWYAALEPGTCYWFIGAGENGKVKKLSIYLWDPRNKRVTENRSDSPSSMVGHCPTDGGMYKFEAKVESGSGAYKVGVYGKKK